MDTDIVITGSVAKWVLPPTQGDLGGTYTGSFTFRCYLTPLQSLQAGREFRELLGGLANQASDVESKLAFSLTQLSHRIIESPPFWTSTKQDGGIAGNLGDLNIISMVLDAAFRAETLFQERIQKERENLLNKTIQAAETQLQKKVE